MPATTATARWACSSPKPVAVVASSPITYVNAMDFWFPRSLLDPTSRPASRVPYIKTSQS
jgi:hypothetical protein